MLFCVSLGRAYQIAFSALNLLCCAWPIGLLGITLSSPWRTIKCTSNKIRNRSSKTFYFYFDCQKSMEQTFFDKSFWRNVWDEIIKSASHTDQPSFLFLFFFLFSFLIEGYTKKMQITFIFPLTEQRRHQQKPTITRIPDSETSGRIVYFILSCTFSLSTFPFICSLFTVPLILFSSRCKQVV